MEYNTCVVIPCAGKGSRLGLPFPKELFPLGLNEVFIDACLYLLINSKEKVRVVVIINKDKLDVVKYLEKYKDDLEMVFIYQKEKDKEFVGALRSASHLFLENNIILLPDTIVGHNRSENLIDESVLVLKDNNMLFWTKSESNISVLKREGCLKLENNEKGTFVAEYADKPTDQLERYNAIWPAIGFNKSVWKKCIDELEASINKLNVPFEDSVFIGAPVIEVDVAMDLGTWPALTDYYFNKGINNNEKINNI